MRSKIIINLATLGVFLLFALAAFAALPVALERQARIDLDAAITNCERGYQAACNQIMGIRNE